MAVRIGLNTGEVLEQDGDVLGEAVHAAARIASAAEGGQIMAADVVRHFAGTMPDLSFHDRGAVQLRGFTDAWRLVEVRWRVDDIEVRLFGSPEIRRTGTAVAVDTRKAIAVLAYLAAESGPISRDTLVGLLWPESTQSKARAALRRTLSTLRSALGEDILHADRDTLSLGGPLVVDCVRFSVLVRVRANPPTGPRPCPSTEGTSSKASPSATLPSSSTGSASPQTGTGARRIRPSTNCPPMLARTQSPMPRWSSRRVASHSTRSTSPPTAS